MKSIYLVLLSVIVLTSCGSDDVLFEPNGPVGQNGAPNEDIATTIVGTYTITSLTIDGVNRTPDFANYTFSYTGNGTLTAQDNSTTETGRWTYILNDDDAIEEFLVINLNGTSTFEAIERSWTIDNTINTTIRLSGFENSTDTVEDVLTFTKQ